MLRQPEKHCSDAQSWLTCASVHFRLFSSISSTVGATDSKKLSAKRRAAAWSQLVDLGEHVQVEISAVQIDAGNLNQLEEAAFIDLIDRFEPDHVYIDAPTTG